MARTALRKVTPNRAAFGQARPATWDNGTDLVLRGYWLHESQPIRVEVPIFQHAFNPKLAHTDLDIRQNISYRTIVLPSMSELRSHGITVERAAVIVETVVHPRNIRNYNYFRTDYPALVMGIAKRDNTLLIIPANDIPSARMKRKQALGFLRMAFTPLFIKGKHYTSGRISMFMASPPGATRKFQAAFNFGEADEKVHNTIAEWHPSVDRVRVTRSRGPRPAYTHRQQRIAAEIIAETSERLRTDLFPIMADKLELAKTSPEGKELEAWLSQPGTSRELLRRTQRNGRSAVKTWVNQILVPKAKEIVSDEVKYATDQLGRWVVRQMLAASVAMVLDLVQGAIGENPVFIGRTIKKLEFNSVVDPTTIGAGRLNYKSGRMPKSEYEQKRRAYEKVASIYAIKTGDSGIDPQQVFNIMINPGVTPSIVVKMVDGQSLEHAAFNAPGAIGKLAADPDQAAKGYPINNQFLQHIVTRLLPDINQEINHWYNEGTPSAYYDYGMGF